MIKILEKLFGLIYTQPCLICGSTKEDKPICSLCYRNINFLPAGVYRKECDCNIYACAIYEEPLKKIIKDLKYHNKKKLARVHALIMYDYWEKLHQNKKFTIIPVPIHKNRLKERKYNHMDLVADEFAKLTGYKVNKNFLKRIKDTQKQYNLHKKERMKNIKDAFEIVNSVSEDTIKSSKSGFAALFNNILNLRNISRYSDITDKESDILIIDDITSTGITLNEIIRILKNNGYKNITALALSTPDIWNN